MKSVSMRRRGAGPAVPDQVLGLTATAVSSSQINLSWNPAATAQTYTIRRDGAQIINLLPGTTYSDLLLSASTTYGYTVSAVNTFGEGLPSAIVSATTQVGANVFPPIAPTMTNLTPTGTADPTSTLRATHTSVINTDHYAVQTRWTGVTTWSRLPSFDHTTTQIDITGNPPNKSIDVQIGACNPGETVPILWSATATASTQPSAGGGTFKWFPGHYVLDNSRPYRPGAYSAFQNAVNDADAAWVNASQRFTGACIEFGAYYLVSPDGASYRFDIIDNALSVLAAKSAARGIDYKLILGLEQEDWVATHTVPQPAPYSNGTWKSIAPDAWINAGWVFNSAGTGVANLRLDIAACMDAYIALCGQLAARYDSNPHIAYFYPLAELGANLGAGSPLNVNNYITQLGRLKTALATQWTQTPVVFMGNFGCTGMSDSQLTALSALFGQTRGMGLGGPDILYGSPANYAPGGVLETSGEKIVRGFGGNFGTTDYRGQTIIAYQQQANSSIWTGQTNANTEGYAFNILKANFIIWCDDSSGSGQHWPTIPAALQAVGFRIANSAYPSGW